MSEHAIECFVFYFSLDRRSHSLPSLQCLYRIASPYYRVKLEQRTNSDERCSSCDEAKRGAEVQEQQHYEASLDLGPTSASPRGRGHGLTLTLGVYVADVERDSVADGVIGVGDRVVKVLTISRFILWFWHLGSIGRTMIPSFLPSFLACR